MPLIEKWLLMLQMSLSPYCDHHSKSMSIFLTTSMNIFLTTSMSHLNFMTNTIQYCTEETEGGGYGEDRRVHL